MTTQLVYRAAVPEDLPSIAKHVCDSPDDGTIWQRPTTPEDSRWLYCMMLDWMASCFLDPGKMIRVAVVPVTVDEAAVGARDEVVGVAIWIQRIMQNGHIVVRQWRPQEDKLVVAAILEEAKQSFHAEHPNPPEPPCIPSHVEALNRSRKAMPTSLCTSTPSLHLYGIGVSPSHRRRGVARTLIRWGQDHNEVMYVTGESRGLNLYRACGFSIIRDSQIWLDIDGKEISAEAVEKGDDGWRQDRGGCSMAEAVWIPEGKDVEVRGVLYTASG